MGDKKYAYIEEKFMGKDANGDDWFLVTIVANADATLPTVSSTGGKLCDCSKAVISDSGTVKFWSTKANDWVEQFSFQD